MRFLFLGLVAPILAGLLSGCAVNVVTVNVTESDLGYVDQAVNHSGNAN